MRIHATVEKHKKRVGFDTIPLVSYIPLSREVGGKKMETELRCETQVSMQKKTIVPCVRPVSPKAGKDLNRISVRNNGCRCNNRNGTEIGGFHGHITTLCIIKPFK